MCGILKGMPCHGCYPCWGIISESSEALADFLPGSPFFKPEFSSWRHPSSCPKEPGVPPLGLQDRRRGSGQWLCRRGAGWLLIFLRFACRVAEWKSYACRNRPYSPDTRSQCQECNMWNCSWLTPWWSKRKPLNLSVTRLFSDDAKFFSFAFEMPSRKSLIATSFLDGISTRWMSSVWVLMVDKCFDEGGREEE